MNDHLAAVRSEVRKALDAMRRVGDNIDGSTALDPTRWVYVRGQLAYAASCLKAAHAIAVMYSEAEAAPNSSQQSQ